MNNTQPDLSIILPAFNEERIIFSSVERTILKLESLKLRWELILVNDGSTDHTLEQMHRCHHPQIIILTYEKNEGKGYAVRRGMQAACGKWKLFMDVDLSTSLDSIEMFINQMNSGRFDLLIGNRRSAQSIINIPQPWHRRFLGQGFITLSSLCVGQNIDDFTCGFKMFNEKSAKIIFARQRIFNWAFDTELLYIAKVHHLRIGQIPVMWNNHANSKVRALTDIMTSLSGLWQIKVNSFRRYYE